MPGCQSSSLPCLQSGKPPPPPSPAAPSPLPPGAAAAAGAPDSSATLGKLALATGGAEKSWPRCVFPFGVVALLIGVAATGITFRLRGPRLDVPKVASVATLLFGAALLLLAALLCWRARRRRRRRRRKQQQQQETEKKAQEQQEEGQPEPPGAW